jgi:biopolymer transport protein ExbD
VGADSLRMQMVAAAARDPIPELQIRADRATQYEHVARVMATAARAGLTKMGFVTEPEPAGR